MRTSRVRAIANSTSRNKRQYLHANDMSHNLAQDGQNRSFMKKLKQTKEQQSDKRLNESQPDRTDQMSNIDLDNVCDINIQHELNDTAMKLKRLNNQKKRLKSYRTSI